MKNSPLTLSLLLVVLLTNWPNDTLRSQSLKRLKGELKVWVKTDNTWGLIDGNQQWIIKPNENYANCINLYEDMAIMELKNENDGDMKSYQVINFNADTLLEFKALQAQFFDHFPTIRIKGKEGYGCINLKGDTLVAPIYKNVSEDFSSSERFITVDDNWKYGLIDDKGEIKIPNKYKALILAYQDRYIARNDSVSLIVSSTDEVITVNTYDTYLPMFLLGENKSVMFSDIYVTKGDYGYLLNCKNGEEAFQTLNYIGGATGNLEWIPFKEGNKQGYKRKNGDLLFSKESNYSHLYPFSDGRAIFRAESNQVKGYSFFSGEGFGVMNKRGKEIVPPIYGFIYSYYNGLASCMIDKKYGFINRRGKVKIPIEYSSAGNILSKDIISVIKEGKHGYLNYRGKVVIPLIYKSISSFDNYILVQEESGKMSVLTKKGKEILPAIYDEIHHFQAPEKVSFADLK